MNSPVLKEYISAKELKNFAKERGIKYFSRMSKNKLCEVLNIKLIEKPNKIFFKNVETGEERGFNSVYKAAREMRVNSGSIFHSEGKKIKIRDVVYTIRRIR